MYKNIVFDLGGVVVDFNPHEFLLDRFYSETVESIVYNITFGSETWAKLDAGLVSREEGNAIMLEHAKEQDYLFEVQSVLDDWMRTLKPRRKTIEIIKRLKRMGFSIFYLSNIAQDTLDELKLQEFWQLFDGGVASFEVHVNKPDEGIYQTLLNQYNLAPSETIFIDDNKPNTTAAFDLGITGIHYKNTASLIRALNTCGIPIKEHLLW